MAEAGRSLKSENKGKAISLVHVYRLCSYFFFLILFCCLSGPYSIFPLTFSKGISLPRKKEKASQLFGLISYWTVAMVVEGYKRESGIALFGFVRTVIAKPRPAPHNTLHFKSKKPITLEFHSQASFVRFSSYKDLVYKLPCLPFSFFFPHFFYSLWQ